MVVLCMLLPENFVYLPLRDYMLRGVDLLHQNLVWASRVVQYSSSMYCIPYFVIALGLLILDVLPQLER